MIFYSTNPQKTGLYVLSTLFICFLVLLYACETEEPIASFSASINISAGRTVLSEDAGDITITVTLSQENTTGSSIGGSYSIGGTATNGTDYSGLSGSISIPNGSRSATATLSITDDSVMEGDETIILSLDETSLPEGINLGNNTELTFTIQDNDAVTVSVSAPSNEAAEPETDGAFTINLSDANNTGEALTINYEVGGTATNGEDYTELSGVAEIADGASSATIAIEVTDDDLIEETETVILSITADGLPEGFELGTAEATVSIADDDMEGFTAEVSMNTPDEEASEDGDNAMFRARLSETNNTGEAIEIAYEISGTATNGEDYNTLSGTVSIPDGEIGAPIPLVVIDDEEVEDEETVILTISSEGLPEGITLSDNSEGTATITDNDEEAFTAEVSLTVTDDAGSEDGDHASFEISLSQTNDTGGAIEIEYEISGTATNGEDYTEISGSVSIAEGQSAASISIEVIDDENVEADETVTLSIDEDSLPEGLTASDNNEASATITDNDEMSFEANASINVDPTEITEGETVTFTISINQSNDTGASLSLQYTLSGTATNGTDFASLNGSVDIANGDDSAEIEVTFTDDDEVEDVETLTITLDAAGQPDGISLSANSSASVSINDNDEAFSATVTVSSDDNMGTEGSDNAAFTFSLDKENSSGAALSIPYTLSGTATNGTDYTSLSGTAEIANGSSSVTVTVEVTDDEDVEEDETVIITLDTDNLPESLSAGSSTSTTLTIADNDEAFSATVTVSSDDNTGTEGNDDATFTFSLDKENSSGAALSIPYTLSGTATNGTDYTSLSSTAEIANGSSSVTVTVEVTDDDEVEEDETVIITLDTDNLPESLSAGSSTSTTLTIADNDETFTATVSVSSDDNTGTEGNDDATFTFSLDKENSTGSALTIPYTISGTATNGTDYASLSGSAEIAAGSSTVTITVDVTDDTEVEEDETVIITLDTGNLPSSLSAGSNTTTITITDNDVEAFSAEASVTASTATGQEGGTNLTFTFSLTSSNTSGADLSIPYSVSGTATSGTDFSALDGTAVIAQNTSETTVSVTIIDDSEAELDETLIITLGSLPEGVTASSSTEATGTITDNEGITLTFGTNSGNSIAISSWTSVSGADGYVVIMNSSNSFTDPTSGSYTPASTSYRGYNQQVIYDGTSVSSLDLSLLASGQSYYFKVYPYSGNRVYATGYTEESSESTACTTTSSSESEVCWSISGDERTMTSNQYPDHQTGSFPNASVTATSRETAVDLTPSLAGTTTYVYSEDSGPSPSNQTFYKFGVASNGLGFNPMGLKPFDVVDSDGNTTGEENWAWQEKVTDQNNTFLDSYGGHVTSAGTYHYHGEITGLATNESGSKHSLIYGFAADGFPIYYKYGFSSDSDFTSSIKELKSSYQLRSGSRGGDGLTAPSGDYDGTYIQDYEFVSGLGDLDECNGRFGVTPEFPEGTYYYVITGDFPVVPNCFKGTPASEFIIGNK